MSTTTELTKLQQYQSERIEVTRSAIQQAMRQACGLTNKEASRVMKSLKDCAEQIECAQALLSNSASRTWIHLHEAENGLEYALLRMDQLLSE
jgi:hypothetical protein